MKELAENGELEATLKVNQVSQTLKETSLEERLFNCINESSLSNHLTSLD